MLSVFREMGKPKWSEIFFVKRNSSKLPSHMRNCHGTSSLMPDNLELFNGIQITCVFSILVDISSFDPFSLLLIKLKDETFEEMFYGC